MVDGWSQASRNVFIIFCTILRGGDLWGQWAGQINTSSFNILQNKCNHQENNQQANRRDYCH